MADTLEIVQAATANLKDDDGASASAEDTSADTTSETSDTESVEATAAVAEGSADIEDGREAQPETPEGEPQTTEAEPKSIDKRAKPKIMPMDRHEQILDKTRKVAQQEIATRDARLRTYEEQVAHWDHALQNPDVLLSSLVQHNPAYASLLRPDIAEKFGVRAPVPNARAANAEIGDKPEPDAVDMNGNITYSAEGYERLAQWHARNAVANAERQFTERFGPIEQSFQKHQQREQAVGRAISKMEYATANWPGFAENQKAIAAEMLVNPKLTLDQAYAKVLHGNRETERAEIEKTTREKLLKEWGRKASAATGLTPGAGSGTPAAASGRSTLDIIRATTGGGDDDDE